MNQYWNKVWIDTSQGIEKQNSGPPWAQLPHRICNISRTTYLSQADTKKYSSALAVFLLYRVQLMLNFILRTLMTKPSNRTGQDFKHVSTNGLWPDSGLIIEVGFHLVQGAGHHALYKDAMKRINLFYEWLRECCFRYRQRKYNDALGTECCDK